MKKITHYISGEIVPFILIITTIIFGSLKLAGAIDWSLWWVASPIIFLIILMIGLTFYDY